MFFAIHCLLITKYQLFKPLTLPALFLYDVSRISVCMCVCVCVCPDSLLSVSLSQIRSQGGKWRGNRKEGYYGNSKEKE